MHKIKTILPLIMFENAQKGAKLSPVHLFGLSKINRNYIQKGREIRRNEKNEKSTINRIITCNDFD